MCFKEVKDRAELERSLLNVKMGGNKLQINVARYAVENSEILSREAPPMTVHMGPGHRRQSQQVRQVWGRVRSINMSYKEMVTNVCMGGAARKDIRFRVVGLFETSIECSRADELSGSVAGDSSSEESEDESLTAEVKVEEIEESSHAHNDNVHEERGKGGGYVEGVGGAGTGDLDRNNSIKVVGPNIQTGGAETGNNNKNCFLFMSGDNGNKPCRKPKKIKFSRKAKAQLGSGPSPVEIRPRKRQRPHFYEDFVWEGPPFCNRIPNLDANGGDGKDNGGIGDLDLNISASSDSINCSRVEETQVGDLEVEGRGKEVVSDSIGDLKKEVGDTISVGVKLGAKLQNQSDLLRKFIKATGNNEVLK
ncbi:hypothetical protein L1987_81308 [Smallanthus sonchifolius]|uniref:Uncharacterized protein n=1 Tax=Smallanthus sonchifolius TaxID=185202 RepID=A0ACB8YQN7_9ASTR|nr:hypothetical protein L1987_81308 [Smallanthus sonchifolius]